MAIRYASMATLHIPCGWIHLQALFKGARLTPQQTDYNKSMSKVRVSVEWVFSDILNYFAFLDFKKNLKVHLSSVGKMYLICGLLHNARICLYLSLTSQYFVLTHRGWKTILCRKTNLSNLYDNQTIECK